MEERLQKIISSAGVASRRKAEQLILEGKVKVNDTIIKELGFKANPHSDKIYVLGKRLTIKTKKVYIALNKPVGIICSRSDEKGRKTVIDIVDVNRYIYPVGRLDFDSSGLVLLTNDGDAMNAIIHPKYEIEKTYIVLVDGNISDNHLRKLESGIQLAEGRTAPAKIKVLGDYPNETKLEMTITEGKNRQIRRMLDAVGYGVKKLKRVTIGKIELGNLKKGEFRYLNDLEVEWIESLKHKKTDT
ncbi:MAG: pseudouridine synthase [Cyanobacteriota bacterium]